MAQGRRGASPAEAAGAQLQRCARAGLSSNLPGRVSRSGGKRSDRRVLANSEMQPLQMCCLGRAAVLSLVGDPCTTRTQKSHWGHRQMGHDSATARRRHEPIARRAQCDWRYIWHLVVKIGTCYAAFCRTAARSCLVGVIDWPRLPRSRSTTTAWPGGSWSAGALGFCESYLDGDWSSPDVETLFGYFLVNFDRLNERMAGRRWYRLAQHAAHLLRPNSRKGAKRNIAHHYDLGNAFYALWLDPTMTYSSALYDGRQADLSTAQHQKYDALLDRMDVRPGNTILEIGCGWGGFAEHAGRRGARVTAITISQEQWAFAKERIQSAGLNDRVDVQLRDYRDVDGQFDRVASIEMFEAVGERYWPVYFGTVRRSLAPQGIAGLQVITIRDSDFSTYRRGADYIQKYIFPGGMLPSPTMLQRGLDQAGLKLRAWCGFGADYAQTLASMERTLPACLAPDRGFGFRCAVQAHVGAVFSLLRGRFCGRSD